MHRNFSFFVIFVLILIRILLLLNNSEHALSTHADVLKHGERKIRNGYDVTGQWIKQLDYALDTFIQLLSIITDKYVASVEE